MSLASTKSHAFQRNLPLLVTGAIFAALFVTAGCLYDGFFSGRVAVNLLTDNAVLGFTATAVVPLLCQRLNLVTASAPRS